jgi:hypothetical protein
MERAIILQKTTLEAIVTDHYIVSKGLIEVGSLAREHTWVGSCHQWKCEDDEKWCETQVDTSFL